VKLKLLLGLGASYLAASCLAISACGEGSPACITADAKLCGQDAVTYCERLKDLYHKNPLSVPNLEAARNACLHARVDISQ
jgi:hypothetical protein